MSDPVYTYIVIFEAIAAFIGLIFNGYILFVLICSKLTVNNILLLFMALADIAICLITLLAKTPMTLMYGIQEVPNFANDSSVWVESPVDSWLCNTEGALWTVIPLCLIWTICGLIVDRYVAIVQPLSYNRLLSVRKTVIIMISVWICLMSFSLPPLFGYCEYKFLLSHSGCVAVCHRTHENGFQFYYILLYLFSFIIAIVIIFCCNAHILTIARNHRHRIVSAIYEITMRAQITITHQSQSSPNYLSKYKGRDAFCTIFQLIGSLVFLTAPYYVIYAFKTFSNNFEDNYWSSSATLILSLTPIVNGYVYGVKSRALRKTFKRLLQRYLYEQQASIEIDRRLSLRSQSSLREGWNSLLITTSLSSNALRSQRRYSAPLSYSPAAIVKQEDNKIFIRRQSLENFSDTQIKAYSDTCVALTKKPSFLMETKITNKIPLSPIQEISHCFSESSSVFINSD